MDQPVEAAASQPGADALVQAGEDGERRTRGLFQQAPGFMCILRGPDYVFEFVNDSYSRLVGGRGDLLGRPLREAVPEVREQGFLALLDQVYSTGKAYTGTATPLRLRREPDGDLVQLFLDFIYQPILDADGRVGGIFVEGFDVTARVTAQTALLESEAAAERQRRLYEAILTNTPDLAYIFGLDHRFTYANEGLLRMWGKTREEAIGKNCLELGYEPWHAALHDREIDQVVQTRQPVRGQVPFAGTFGRRIYDYILVPVFGADGEVEAVAGTTRDVTDSNAVAESLRRSETRYRTLFEAIDEGFCVIELVAGTPVDFRYLVANPAFAVQTGVGDVVGRTIREAFPGEPSYWFETYERVLASGEPIRFEHDLVSRSRTLELYAFPLTDEGRRDRLGVIFQDVTARKRAERHRDLLINELNHRVKNTLATVQSIAMQTLRTAPSAADARLALETRLIALAKAHDVLTREHWASADLHQVVTMALDAYVGQEGRVAVAGPPLRVLPRASLTLSMALHELATNAVKYGALSLTAGTIAIGWQATDEDGFRLTWRERGGPPVVRPRSRGFGSRLIEQGLSHDLRGNAQLAFEAAGVECIISAPLGEIVAAP